MHVVFGNTGTDRSRPDNQSGLINQANLNRTSNPKPAVATARAVEINKGGLRRFLLDDYHSSLNREKRPIHSYHSLNGGCITNEKQKREPPVSKLRLTGTGHIEAAGFTPACFGFASEFSSAIHSH